MLQPVLTPARSATARTRLYALLCLAVAPPEPWHRDWMCTHLAGVVNGLETHLPLQGVRDGLLALSGSVQLVTHRELLVEYARLDRLAPPYESYYRDGTGLLAGESAAAVLAAYRQAGYTTHRGWRDLPDHLQAELEFMASATEREAAGWRRGDAAAVDGWLATEADFLREHLSLWIGDYVQRLRAAEPLPFYLVVADALENTMMLDRQWIAGLRRHVAVAASTGDHPAVMVGNVRSGVATRSASG